MMKHIYLRLAFLFIGVCSLVSCSDDKIESAFDPKEWNLDADMDMSYAPGDNFFMYCNGTWYKNVDMTNEYFVGTHLNDGSENNKRIAALANDETLKKFDADTLTIDQTAEYAYASIIKNINEVTAGINTKEDAWKAIAKSMKKGYQPFFSIDFDIVDGVIYAIMQPTMTFKANTIQGVKHVLIKMGLDDERAAKSASMVMTMRKKLEGVVHRQDLSIPNLVKYPELREQLIQFNSLKSRASGTNVLSTVLQQLGIDERYVKSADNQASYLEAIQQLSVDEIKSYLTYYMADDICMASYQDLAEYNTANATDYTIRYLSDYIKNNYMKYSYSYAYAIRYVTPEMKEKWTGINEELRTTFRNRINNLDWMSSITKAKAVEKLEAMKFNVGYPDHWITEGLPSLQNSKSFVEDVQQVYQAYYNLSKSFIGKDAKDEGFNLFVGFIYNLTVMNAFYNPMFNSLYIYPAVLIPPVYDEKNSDATMYACAIVLGHEMTHGFDSNGAKYDKLGNYRNWWTVSDKMDFLAKQQLLIDCYNNLEIMPDELPGVYADGAKTLSENIADLGGVEIAYQSYIAKLKQQGYTGDELIKQEKRFFQAYADFWKARYEWYFAKAILETDVHSLQKERVNGVVMNCDRWYELYDVKWGNQLYLRPEKRSHIW